MQDMTHRRLLPTFWVGLLSAALFAACGAVRPRISFSPAMNAMDLEHPFRTEISALVESVNTRALAGPTIRTNNAYAGK